MLLRRTFYIFILAVFSINTEKCIAQKKIDTVLVAPTTPPDSSHKSLLKQDTSADKFHPRIATLRSALIPGWGQAYNKKYWKIPIIYGALGTTAGIFFYNLKTYKLLRQAVVYRSSGNPADADKVDPQFKILSTETIRSYRNSFRQNIDYSVLFFLGFWAVNVVDATVDAHLKSFDVNDNISMRLRPDFNSFTRSPSLSMSFNIHESHAKSHSFQ